MKVGIIGPSGSGKTTLFNALTGMEVQTGGGKKVNHVAVVKVLDSRLDKLYEMIEGKKLVTAEIAFSDVGGGITKPSRDQGMDPQLMNMMKAEDAFAMVVGDFEEYIRPNGEAPNPLAEARELDGDLIIADLVVIESKLERTAKDHNPGLEKEVLIKCREHLEKDLPLRLLEITKDELKAISGYKFLSQKQGIIIRNIGEANIGAPEPAGIEEFAKSLGLKYMTVAAKVQMEISRMPQSEREEFVSAMGLDGFVLEKFIRAAMESLELITFFTVGGPQKEVHAWTARQDSSAVEAAGKIHTDIQRGFIRAEVTSYEDYVAFNGEAGAKQHGKMRLEGKDYVVKDGDIVLFRFNI